MTAIIGILASVLPLILRYGGNLFTGGSAVVVAVISAVPGTLSAIGGVLDAVGKSPLLAFLLGSFMLGTAGFFYGVSYDAPLRARIERRAIDSANIKADNAINRVRAEYQRKLEAVEAQLAKPEAKRAKR